MRKWILSDDSNPTKRGKITVPAHQQPKSPVRARSTSTPTRLPSLSTKNKEQKQKAPRPPAKPKSNRSVRAKQVSTPPASQPQKSQEPSLPVPPNMTTSDLHLALLPLPNCHSPEFETIYLAKIAVCVNKCTFTNAEELPLLKIKSQCLTQILDALDIEDFELSSEAQNRTFSMITTNLIRPLKRVDIKTFYLDDIPPLMEPSMPHLGGCYAMLIKMYGKYPDNLAFNDFFLFKLADNLASIDSNERELLVIFFIRYLKATPTFVFPFLDYAARQLQRFMVISGMPTQVWALLKICNEIFAGCDTRPFEPFFVNNVIPLCKHIFFTYYEFQYSDMVERFLIQTDVVVSQMLKCWPVKSISKQVSFIIALSNLLPLTDEENIETFTIEFFNILSKCVCAQSPRLCMSAMQAWLEPSVEKLIAAFDDQVLPTYLRGVKKAAKEHWNEDVRSTAATTLDYFSKVDPKIAKGIIEEESAPDENANIRNNWMAIVNTAAENDEQFDVKAVNEQIESIYRS